MKKKSQARFFILIGYTLLSSLLSTTLFAQQEADHSHIHPQFEIGISSAAVKLIEENEITIGFHTHITTYINHNHSLLAGVGYEYILDEHQHHSLGILLGWSPVHELLFSISPGITTNKGDIKYTTHLEASYAFEIGKIHLGPSAEYAYTPGDTHVSIGIHLGIPINSRD